MSDYGNFTAEQKSVAHNTDIIDFLIKTEGFSFVRAGNGYRCKEHNSLYIQPDRKSWFWNSKQISGGDAIDWCRKINGTDYPSALALILGENGEKTFKVAPPAPTVVEKTSAQLQLPEKFKGRYSRAFDYLNITRGIDRRILQDFMGSPYKNTIFQDTRNNVVFVGLDKDDNARFACIRGTLSNVQFRGDCTGSDKRYAFNIPGNEAKDKVYVFESPIDLLSHCTIANIVMKDNLAFKKHNRISLSGVSDVALEHYLNENPQIKKIVFCLDNDEAGRKASSELSEKYSAKGFECSIKLPRCKDFNEDLLSRYIPMRNFEQKAWKSPEEQKIATEKAAKKIKR